MNQTDISILKLSEAGRAALALVDKLRARAEEAEGALLHLSKDENSGLAIIVRCKAHVEKVEAQRDEWKARAEKAARRAESAELGCDIAYRREPTQEEGDAHEDKQHQSMGPELPTGECFVAMGGWTGRRCRHCGRWVWGGPTACAVCVERASRDELGIQLAAQSERLRLAMACVEEANRCDDICTLSDEYGRRRAALDAVPGDALATSTKKDGE